MNIISDHPIMVTAWNPFDIVLVWISLQVMVFAERKVGP